MRVEANTGFTITKKNGIAVGPGYSGDMSTGLFYALGDSSINDLIAAATGAAENALFEAGIHRRLPRVRAGQPGPPRGGDDRDVHR